MDYLAELTTRSEAAGWEQAVPFAPVSDRAFRGRPLLRGTVAGGQMALGYLLRLRRAIRDLGYHAMFCPSPNLQTPNGYPLPDPLENLIDEDMRGRHYVEADEAVAATDRLDFNDPLWRYFHPMRAIPEEAKELYRAEATRPAPSEGREIVPPAEAVNPGLRVLVNPTGDDWATTVDVLAVPVDHNWQACAVLHVGDVNDCPHGTVHAAFHRLLAERYGAMPIAISYDTVELLVPMSEFPWPAERSDEARELADLVYRYCWDMIEQGHQSHEALAEYLMGHCIWEFWWD